MKAVSLDGVSEAASHFWTVDLTDPQTTIDFSPADPTNATGASFDFSSSEGSSTFECQLDGAGFSTCTSPKSYSGLSAGAHTFEVRATDAAGNTDATPALHTWTIDLTDPNTSITASPSDPSNDADPSFSFTSSEAGSTFECKLDAGAFAPCTSPKSYTGLAAGSHTFEVKATDAAGNLDPTSASHTWTVDLTKPRAVTDFRARARPGSATLRWTLPTDVDFDRVRIKRRRIGTTIWKTVLNRYATSYTDKGLVNEVKYRYRAVSIDKAGNVSDPAITTARPSRVFTPQYGATVSAPVLVDWVTVGKATYYNMQIWRNGRKILSVWPNGSRYRIPSRWTFDGRRYGLNSRRHDVYVWPGFGSKAAARYGRLLGPTSFFGA